MKLRKYQEEAHSALTKHAKKKKSGILSLATGGGKTFTAAKWAYDNFLSQGKPIFWVTHRDTLDKQAYKTFKSNFPEIEICRWNSQEKEVSKTGVTLVSIFSARKFPKTAQAALVVYDEAHHEQAKSWLDFDKNRKPEYKLGLTACTDRLDGKSLGFQDVVYSKSLFELMQEGFAPKANVYMLRTQQAYSMARNRRDFTNASLAQLDNEERNKLIVEEYLKGDYGKTIAFACNTDHAYELAEMFKKRGVNAIGLTSKDNIKLREEEVEKVLNNEYDVVINIGLYTEGFDWPECETVFLIRPTMSKNLYLQMIGRGARLSPGSNTIDDSEKKTFNAVHFIDDIHQYAYVAENWAVDHLGLQSRAVAQRRADEASEAAIKEALDDLGLKPSSPKVKKVTGLERKLIEIAGVGQYSSQFFYNRKIVMTQNDLYALDLFHEYLSRANPSEMYAAVNESYGVFADTVDLEPNEWKSLCWASYFKNQRGQNTIRCQNGRDAGKDGITFDIRRFTDSASEQGIKEDVDRFLKERNEFDNRIKPKASNIVDTAISSISQDPWVRRSIRGKVTLREYTSRKFELEYDSEIAETYTWKELLKTELCNLCDGEVTMVIKPKSNMDSPYPPEDPPRISRSLL